MITLSKGGNNLYLFESTYDKVAKKEGTMQVKVELEDIELEDIEYDESVEIIYKQTLRLYESEMESYNVLTNKTNGIIIFNVAIIAFITSAFTQLTILVIKNEMSFSLILLVVPYIFLIISLNYAIRSYKPTELPAFDPIKFYKFCYDKQKSSILNRISKRLVKDTLKVKEKVRERGNLIDKSLYYLIAGILTFILIIFSVILI